MNPKLNAHEESEPFNGKAALKGFQVLGAEALNLDSQGRRGPILRSSRTPIAAEDNDGYWRAKCEEDNLV